MLTFVNQSLDKKFCAKKLIRELLIESTTISLNQAIYLGLFENMFLF